MQKLHKRMMKKSRAYAAWHKTPYISAAHFIILAGFGAQMAMILQQALA